MNYHFSMRQEATVSVAAGLLFLLSSLVGALLIMEGYLAWESSSTYSSSNKGN